MNLNHLTQKIRKVRMNPFTSPSMAIAATAVLGLGFTMPSCPGQQAMQQQVDALQTKVNEDAGKIEALSTQVATMNQQLTEARNLLCTVSQTVLGQKDQIMALEEGLKEAQSKLSSGKGARRR